MPYWFDGNNLIGRSAEAAGRDPRIRNEFLMLLSTYATQRGGRFVVFFDGDDPDRRMPPRRVQVHYCAPLSADDAIVQRARGSRTPSEIIVVTNDRDLGRRCRDAGTRIMNWSEFASKANPKSSRSGKSGADEQVDPREWARYFGLDPKDLE